MFAFEADERSFQCAQINVEMAASVLGVGNVMLVPKAVWSNNDGLIFSHEGAMGSSAVSITGGHRGAESKVPTVRVQDFAAEHRLAPIDFVKMDIEGCEIEVLRDSAAFLHSLHARLIVEPHLVEGVLSTERCRELLTAAGYTVRVRPKTSESEGLIEAAP